MAEGTRRSEVKALRPRHWGMGVVVVAVTATACQVSVKHYVPAAAHRYDNSKVIKGISVIATPLPSSGDQETYFGMNMSAKGALPIYISLTNNNRDRSFIVDAYTIDVNRNTGNAPSGSSVTRSQRITGDVLTPLSPIIGTIISINTNIIAEAIELNMFTSGTVEPGQQLAGFYYADINSIDDNGKNTLCIQASDPLKDTSFPCCVEFEKGK